MCPDPHPHSIVFYNFLVNTSGTNIDFFIDRSNEFVEKKQTKIHIFKIFLRKKNTNFVEKLNNF